MSTTGATASATETEETAVRLRLSAGGALTATVELGGARTAGRGTHNHHGTGWGTHSRVTGRSVRSHQTSEALKHPPIVTARSHRARCGGKVAPKQTEAPEIERGNPPERHVATHQGVQLRAHRCGPPRDAVHTPHLRAGPCEKVLPHQAQHIRGRVARPHVFIHRGRRRAVVPQHMHPRARAHEGVHFSVTHFRIESRHVLELVVHLAQAANTELHNEEQERQ